MVIVRRFLLGAVVVAVVAVWATNKLHDTKHYSDVAGQGASLSRTVLPPLDTDTGGPVPLPDSGSTSSQHIAAQQAGVDPRTPVPGALQDRQPDATPQDPQQTPRPTVGSQGDGTTHPASSLNLDSLTGLLSSLSSCDATCLTNVISSLGGGTFPPVNLPINVPITVPIGGSTP